MHQKETNQFNSDLVPMISFGARGTLFYDQPPLEAWLLSYLNSRGKTLEEQELRALLLNSMAHRNEEVEADLSRSIEKRSLFRSILAPLFEENELEAELQRATDAHHLAVKVVIPRSVVELCEELKTRGYRLAIVSNESEALIELLRYSQLIDLFERVILAQDVGVAKPDPKIFQILLEEAELKPAQVVHVGDRYATDVLGANRAGILSFLYDPLRHESLAIAQAEAGHQKVVDIEDIRKQRFYRGTRILSRLDELLECFE